MKTELNVTVVLKEGVCQTLSSSWQFLCYFCFFFYVKVVGYRNSEYEGFFFNFGALCNCPL